MVQAVIAPDGREPGIISDPIGCYEGVGILAMIGLEDEDAPSAAECGHVPVAGITVQRVAALGTV